MRIKVKNKNRINNTGTYAENNLINYRIDDGFTITKNYNETLDSAVIRISHQTSKIDIEPFDEIIMYDDARFSKSYWCVDTYTCTQECIDNGNVLYSYTISLFSQTKMLEGIILPNLSITPLKTGQKRSIWYYLQQYNNEYGAKKRSLEHIDIRRYKTKEYGEGESGQDIARFYLTETVGATGIQATAAIETQGEIGEASIVSTEVIQGNFLTEIRVTYNYDTHEEAGINVLLEIHVTANDKKTFTNKWTFDNNIQTRFNAIECPELQWNAPTFREVLNDLMMIDDCIVTLNNGVIGYLDLTQKRNAITNYNYIQETQSSSDYVSELKMNMQNALQTSVANVKDTITTTEYIPFTTDGYSITTDNFLLKTKYPILSVKSLKMGYFWWLRSFEGEEVIDSYYPCSIDLCNVDGYSLIKEYKEYQTLELLKSYQEFDPSVQTGAYFSQYQNYCAFFNRGSNTITGFNNLSKQTDIFGFTMNTYQAMKLIAIRDADNHVASARPYFTIFKVEYETTANQVFSAGKSDYKENYRQIVDNQTNSWVDAYTQGNLEYQKANRLGNKGLFINQRVLDNNYIQLGDYLEDSIVYQVEYQVYDNHIETNANACKDYILRDYFTGINSKIRTWNNAQDEAFKKDELVKYYCEFSNSKKVEYYNPTKNIASYLLTSAKSNVVRPLQQALIRTESSSWVFPSLSKYFLQPLLSKVIGDSLSFSTGFDDNASAGKYINVNSIEQITPPAVQAAEQFLNIPTSQLVGSGGVPLTNYTYTDNHYECENFDIVYSSDVILQNNDISAAIENNTPYVDTTTEIRDGLVERYKLPVVDDDVVSETSGSINEIIFANNVVRHKDNKEIPTFTLQFEFCCENRNMYFTKYWLQNQQAVRTTTMPNINVYTSEDFVYGSEKLPTDRRLEQTQLNIRTFQDTNASASIEIEFERLIEYGRYVYIVNGAGDSAKVLLCWGVADDGQTQNIYLNVLKDRNKWIYNANGEKTTQIGG